MLELRVVVDRVAGPEPVHVAPDAHLELPGEHEQELLALVLRAHRLRHRGGRNLHEERRHQLVAELERERLVAVVEPVRGLARRIDEPALARAHDLDAALLHAALEEVADVHVEHARQAHELTDRRSRASRLVVGERRLLEARAASERGALQAAPLAQRRQARADFQLLQAFVLHRAASPGLSSSNAAPSSSPRSSSAKRAATSPSAMRWSTESERFMT